MNDKDLEAQILKAHAAGDLTALVEGYVRAAEGALDSDQAGFFLTQAFIFALEAGDPRANDIKAQLVVQGREVET